MPSSSQGSIRLFRAAGITVFLHWSWFLVAAFEINARSRSYSSLVWNVAEYLALFLIVLLHEFGHSLACRQVGGNANRIVLWPLGGVAYVDPPPRPGATLWSIAAGPLVNVALTPILIGLIMASTALGWRYGSGDVHKFLVAVLWVNVVLFAFNILPIYPLDGGQILRSLLWFVLGRARSLMVATVLGFIGVVLFVAAAIWGRSLWFGALAAFMLMNCWAGLQQARVLLRLAKLPRRHGFACPRCNTAPPVGAYWRCAQCGRPFDTFQTQAVCPNCASHFPVTMCLDCRGIYPISEWAAPAVIDAK